MILSDIFKERFLLNEILEEEKEEAAEKTANKHRFVVKFRIVLL